MRASVCAREGVCVCECVFYNWLCLLHNPVDTSSPFTPPPPPSRYGKIVSTKAILDKTTNKCKGAKCCWFLFFCVFFSLWVLFSLRGAGGRGSRTLSTRVSRLTGVQSRRELRSCLGVKRAGQETDSRAARSCLPVPCYFKPPSSVTAVGGSSKEVALTPPLPA